MSVDISSSEVKSMLHAINIHFFIAYWYILYDINIVMDYRLSLFELIGSLIRSDKTFLE